MADWSKPTLTSTYTAFVTEVKDRDVEVALWFEGMSPTNLPTNAKRLNASTGRFEKWNGSAWVDAVATFTFPALAVAGAASIAGALTLSGGTANGIPYLNAGKVITTGSALTFNGSTAVALDAGLGSGGFTVTGAIAANQALGFYIYDANHGMRVARTSAGDVSNVCDFLEYGGAWHFIKTEDNSYVATLNASAFTLLNGRNFVTSGDFVTDNGAGRLTFSGEGTANIIHSTATGFGAYAPMLYAAASHRFGYGASANANTAFLINTAGIASFNTEQTPNNARVIIAANHAGVGQFSWAQRIGTTAFSDGSFAVVGYGVETSSFSKGAFGYRRDGAYDVGSFVWALNKGFDTSSATAADILLALNFNGELAASATATSGWQVPRGTTAQRPGGAAGFIRFNTSLSRYEGHNGSGWASIGGGATGGGSDDVFYENGQTVSTNYTINSGKNAMSAGPVTIASGITVTVPSGSTWVVV